MDHFTRTVHASTLEQNLATLPVESARPYAYYIKIGNEGTMAQTLVIEQHRHTNQYRDRTVVPANGQTDSGGFPAVGDTIALGGNPEEDKLLTFDAGGTIDTFIHGSPGGGSMPVTVGFALP